jgi:hypothetical protein
MIIYLYIKGYQKKKESIVVKKDIGIIINNKLLNNKVIK